MRRYGQCGGRRGGDGRVLCRLLLGGGILLLHGLNLCFEPFGRALLGNPLVVFGAFLRVGQDFVGLVDELHDAVGIGVGVQIGVVLFGQAAVGLADGLRVGIGGDVQVVVVRADSHEVCCVLLVFIKRRAWRRRVSAR